MNTAQQIDRPDTQVVASVIICTHNRATYLTKTIEAAAAQVLTQGAFEILVVDNNSKDNTREVVADCQARISTVPVRYVFEAETGLSNARNRGISAAEGQILCFLDDDAVPESNWLHYLCEAYATDKFAMCVGGCVIPAYESPLPKWFGKEFEGVFSPLISSDKLVRVKYPEYPYGANLSFRANIFKTISGFRPDLGYQGKSLLPSEETDMLLRIEQSKGVILFEPRAVVKHVIPASRLSREYMRKRFLAQGRGDAFIEQLQYDSVNQIGLWCIVREAFWYFRKAIREYIYILCLRLHHSCPESSNSNFSEECLLLRELGRKVQAIQLLTAASICSVKRLRSKSIRVGIGWD